MQTEINNIQKEVNKLGRRLDGVKNDLKTRHKERAKRKIFSIIGTMDTASFKLEDIYSEMEELDGRSN